MVAFSRKNLVYISGNPHTTPHLDWKPMAHLPKGFSLTIIDKHFLSVYQNCFPFTYFSTSSFIAVKSIACMSQKSS